MVVPATGTIVLVPFPFSDLSQAKLRPALVVASIGRGDWILCQITSNPYGDVHAVGLSDQDFAKSSLRSPSYIRPGKLFTANQVLIANEVGQLKSDAFKRIVGTIVAIVQSGLTP
jgi:mRNA interferase MazF